MPDIDKLKHITYRFVFPAAAKNESSDGPPAERTFTVFLEKTSHDLVQPLREDQPIPEWTRLEFAKCSNCPLAAKEYTHCPTARALVEVVDFFADLPSFEHVIVEAKFAGRTVTKETTLQEGLRALMGLIMPTSGCPILGKLRPMTITHTPFSTQEETIFRAVAAHLIGEYYKSLYGGDASFDLNALKDVYNEIHLVNRDFINRLKQASSEDAALNGLVSLDILTMSLPMAIDKELNKFLTIFAPELLEAEDTPSCR